MDEQTPLRLLAYTDTRDLGGAELCLGLILAHLSEAVDVSVVGVDAGVVERITAGRKNATSVVLPPPTRELDARSIVRHVRTFRSLRPDVCHVNLHWPTSCVHGLVAGLVTPDAKVVAVEHLPTPFGGIVRRWTKRRTSRRVDAHVASSLQSSRDSEQLFDLPPGTVRTIYNGVSAEPERTVTHLAPGPTIGSIGRLDRQKGFDVLLRAVADLPGVTLVIVGDGPERGALESQAEQLSIGERVIFTGWVDDPRALLGAFDVFALVSRYESFPLALLEAMHAAVPVVATAIGGVPEMIDDGNTGLLVPADDVAALTPALARLLQDAALRERLGFSGRDVARARFTAEAMARAYESLYRELART